MNGMEFEAISDGRTECKCSVENITLNMETVTRVLKESIIQKFSVFERKLLRRIFGPTKEANGIWRIETNKELDKLNTGT